MLKIKYSITGHAEPTISIKIF